MRTRALSVAFIFLAVIVSPSRSQEPFSVIPFPLLPVAQQKDKEKIPEKKGPEVPPQDFTQAPSTDAMTAGGFSPHMLGDFPPFFSRVRVPVFGTLVRTTTITPIGPGGGATV